MAWILKADRPSVCYCKPGECAAPRPNWCISKRAAEHPELLAPPDGLYVVRNGIAVAVTVETLNDMWPEVLINTSREEILAGILSNAELCEIQALSRPADGADK